MRSMKSSGYFLWNLRNKDISRKWKRISRKNSLIDILLFRKFEGEGRIETADYCKQIRWEVYQ